MMTTTEGNSKKTERDNNDSTGGVEGDNDRNKRQRTSSSLSVNEEDEINPSSSQVAATPDPAVSAIELNNAVAATSNAVNMNELPTTDQLSQELCKIVDIVHYSRDESVRALENLHDWAFTKDADFLKSYHTYGGIAKVLDFLKATMNDGNCMGSIRMKCIEIAADVISTVTYTSDENDDNKDTARDIATTLLDCDGIDTLINASEEYTGGDDIPQLNAVRSVWNAIMNLTYHVTSNSLMSQDKAIVIFDTGIDIMAQVKFVDNSIASRIFNDVFCTFYNIVLYDHVTKKYFQDKNILPKCLEVFKKNGAWNFRSHEGLIQEAVDFFKRCHIKHLLDDSSDYEKILPLLVIAIKKFPSNDEIRGNVVGILDDACSKANNKKIILRSGVMEPLGLLFASDEINNEDEKNKVRTLINKIIA